MAWRRSTREWEAGRGASNKRAFKKLVTSGRRPGVIGYLDGAPIAWCAVAPREDYPRLARSRVLKPIDERPVWSVSCLFVLKSYRRQGVSARLLRAAVDFVADRGGRWVEGYPVVPTMKSTPDPFVWTGLPSSFLRAGFREVHRPSKNRPIMRREIRRRSPT
jgi:GNAT superfamily N-acetyltransferase